MPRLTNRDYLKLQHWLADLWRHNFKSFGLLSYQEQRHLHDYFVPGSLFEDDDLLRYRSKISKDDPGLPAAAGRAASRLKKKMAEFQPYPQPHPQASVPPKVGKKRVTVHAVARPSIDHDVMSQALRRVLEGLGDQDADELAL